MSNKRIRTITRIIHLIGAALISAYLYTPLGGEPAFMLVVRAVVVPLLGLTGLVLWQQARVLRLLGRPGRS